MLENQKIKKGEKVRFTFNNEIKKIGIIVTVDIQGSIENIGKPTYDIFGKLEGSEDTCLYKHISEMNVARLININETEKEELNFITYKLNAILIDKT